MGCGFCDFLLSLIQPFINLGLAIVMFGGPVYVSSRTGSAIARSLSGRSRVSRISAGLFAGRAIGAAVLVLTRVYVGIFDWMLDDLFMKDYDPYRASLWEGFWRAMSVLPSILEMFIEGLIITFVREFTRLYITTAIVAGLCLIYGVKGAKSTL